MPGTIPGIQTPFWPNLDGWDARRKGSREIGRERKARGETGEEVDVKGMGTWSCPSSYARDVKSWIGYRNQALGFLSYELKRWEP